MYVAPVRLSAEESEFARLMAEPPTPHAEAVAFAEQVEREQDTSE
jgi:hypothetical protein